MDDILDKNFFEEYYDNFKKQQHKYKNCKFLDKCNFWSFFKPQGISTCR